MSINTMWIKCTKVAKNWNVEYSNNINKLDLSVDEIVKEVLKEIKDYEKDQHHALKELKIHLPQNANFRVELTYSSKKKTLNAVIGIDKLGDKIRENVKKNVIELFSKIENKNAVSQPPPSFTYMVGTAIDIAGTNLRMLVGTNDFCYSKTSGSVYAMVMEEGTQSGPIRSGEPIASLWGENPPEGLNPDDLFREFLNKDKKNSSSTAKVGENKENLEASTLNNTPFNWNNRSIGGLNFSGKNLSNTSSGSSSANSPINDNTHIIQRRAPFRQGFESHSLNSSETNLPGSSASNPGSPLNISTRIKRKDASNSLNSSGTNLPNSSASSPATPLNTSPRTTPNDLSISDSEINDEVGESKENLKVSTTNRTKFIWKSPTVRSLHTVETNLPNSSASNPGNPLGPLNNSPRNNIPNTQGKDAFRPGFEINAEIDENKENLEAST